MAPYRIAGHLDPSQPCPICGARFSCPAGQDIHLLPPGAPVLDLAPPGPGWRETQQCKRYSIWVPASATLVGRAAANRIAAHGGGAIEAVRVGHCLYALRKYPCKEVQ